LGAGVGAGAGVTLASHGKSRFPNTSSNLKQRNHTHTVISIERKLVVRN